MRLILFALILFTACTSKQEETQALEGFPLKVTGTLIQHDSIPTSYVKVRPVTVWIPEGYNESEERYPVVYFMDGQNVFDPKLSFIGVDWAIDEWADSLMRTGEIKKAIIVGVWNTEDRGPEYYPEKANKYLTTDAISSNTKRYGSFTPKADNFLKYMTEDIKPFIDKTYRTKTEQENTTIAGSSMGGLISLYAVSEYPDVFGTALCFSTHFPVGEGVTLKYFAKKTPKAGNHKIYFDYGTKTLDAEYEPYQIQMDAIMIEKGYVNRKDWTTLKFEGQEHSERAWRLRAGGALKFALGK